MYNNPHARQNPYSIVKKFGKGPAAKAKAEKYLITYLKELEKKYYDLGVSSLGGEWMITAHIILRNPLLQTVFAANPPISGQWNSLTKRQRLYALMAAGVSEELSDSYAHRLWLMLPGNVRSRIEASWFDSSERGTTRRRHAVPVGANPLTRQEAGAVLSAARSDVRMARVFRPGHTRSEKSGQAYAKAQVVRRYGPRAAHATATKIMRRAQDAVGTTMSNPGVRLPRPGTRLTVAQALELAQRLGNKSLVKQCHAAMRLQKASDRNTKCVVWKHLPIGSKTHLDGVVAMTHYGRSPEDMYTPPKGSKKGPHMYRHRWKKHVDVLASPSGKAIVKLMGPGQKVGDWMRG